MSGRRLRTHAAVAALVALLVLPITASAQDAEADPLPPAGTVLEPGRYVSSAVGPSVAFRVDEGWVVGETPPGPIFVLERTDQPGTVLTVTRFDGDVYIDSCDDTSLTQVQPSVERIAQIIGGNPYVVPGPPALIEVDGYRGLRLDVGVPAYTECDLPFVLIWALPIGEGGEFIQFPNQQSRFVMVDVDGTVLVIAIESFPGAPFGGLLEASMALIDSMRLEPGEYVPPEPSPPPTSSPSPEPSSSPAPDPTPTAASA